jgi:hypothetical protein
MNTHKHTRAARNLARPLPTVTTQPGSAAVLWALAAFASLIALAVILAA